MPSRSWQGTSAARCATGSPSGAGPGGLAPADRRSVRPLEAGTSAPGVDGLAPRAMHRLRGVVRGITGCSYQRCCIWTSENRPFTHSGE
jgi:hypothetical protein